MVAIVHETYFPYAAVRAGCLETPTGNELSRIFGAAFRHKLDLVLLLLQQSTGCERSKKKEDMPRQSEGGGERGQ